MQAGRKEGGKGKKETQRKDNLSSFSSGVFCQPPAKLRGGAKQTCMSHCTIDAAYIYIYNVYVRTYSTDSRRPASSTTYFATGAKSLK